MDPADSEHYRAKILDDHPLLFRGRHKPITESLMSFGFCCADGWLPLIERLSDRIEAEIVRLRNEDGILEDDLPEAQQVKEKFGGLRFYVSPANDRIFAALMAAREEADRTCEYCGALGKRCEQGAIATCCNTSAQQRGWET